MNLYLLRCSEDTNIIQIIDNNRILWNILVLTISLLNLITYYCGKWGTCTKFEYNINHRLSWVRNGCPGCVTGVAWYGWARNWRTRGPGFDILQYVSNITIKAKQCIVRDIGVVFWRRFLSKLLQRNPKNWRDSLVGSSTSLLCYHQLLSKVLSINGK